MRFWKSASASLFLQRVVASTYWFHSCLLCWGDIWLQRLSLQLSSFLIIVLPEITNFCRLFLIPVANCALSWERTIFKGFSDESVNISFTRKRERERPISFGPQIMYHDSYMIAVSHVAEGGEKTRRCHYYFSPPSHHPSFKHPSCSSMGTTFSNGAISKIHNNIGIIWGRCVV